MIEWQPTGEEVHIMEQQWPVANAKLEEELDLLRQNIPLLEKQIGLSGPSTVFAYMRAFLAQSRLENGIYAVAACEILCAAAFTKLTRATRDTDDMSQYEREYEDDN